MTSPRIEIDWTRCDGHGLCHALAPDLIGRDEWGFPVLPEQPPSSADGRRMRRVAAACPALALRLDTR